MQRNPQVEDITPGAYKGIVTQNLFTTPIVIDNLDGDKYDYTIAFWKTVSNSSIIALYPNGDTASNYRVYQQYGVGATADATVFDTLDHGFIVSYTLTAGTDIPFAVMRITGESGGERHCQGLRSQSDGSNPYLIVNDIYWKNTADNITSFTMKGYASADSTFQFKLYRSLKGTSLKDYELVKEVDISSRDLQTNPVIFGGVSDTEGVEIDGDLYGEYVVETQLDIASVVRLNNDAGGSNYEYQYVQNSNGSLSADDGTISGIVSWAQSVTNIASDKSFGYRVSNTSGSLISAAQQRNYSTWWLNSADNITSIEVTDTITTPHSGKIRLYVKLPPGSFDGLPWELVGSYGVTTNFQGGYDFNNLDGDNTFLYKVKCIAVQGQDGGNVQIDIRPNNDFGGNYSSITLTGSGTTTSAVNSTSNNSYPILSTDSQTHPSIGEMYIYPKSGYARPCLVTENRYDGSEVAPPMIRFAGQWWDNTVSNITSLRVRTGTSTIINVYFELYRIPFN